MARARLCIVLLLAGCGLASKDYDVEQAFQAGGGPPSFTGSFNSTQLLGPLSADVSKVSTVTLQAARIEATDNNGDISFISGASISVGSPILPVALIATLSTSPAAGATSVPLQITPKELKPYLQAGGTVSASITYSPTPVNARELRLVLTIHGSLL